jgi:hypothetical protein
VAEESGQDGASGGLQSGRDGGHAAEDLTGGGEEEDFAQSAGAEGGVEREALRRAGGHGDSGEAMEEADGALAEAAIAVVDEGEGRQSGRGHGERPFGQTWI